MKISVIVPIYNVERYLRKCIDSLIEQVKNEYDLEILLVDDGSTDNSGKICDEYASKKTYISVFHKKNGGLSDARNYGIYKSNGDFLIFIDSDDYVSNNFFEKIINKINKDIDIVFWDAKYVDDDNEEITNIKYPMKHVVLNENYIYTGKKIFDDTFSRSKELPTAVWLGAYRKDFILGNTLFFEKGLLHEDEMWSFKTIYEAKNVVYISDDLYCYRIRKNSIMRDSEKDRKHIESYIYIYNSLIEYFCYKEVDKKNIYLILDNIVKRYLHALGMWNSYKYGDILKRVNKKNIIKYSKSYKNKVRAYVFGINKYFYCYLLNKK